MKKLATVFLAIISIVVSTLVIQFGWNEIMITIIDVNKISFWQAFGLDVLLTHILPKEKLKEDYKESFSDTAFRGILSTIIYAGLLLLASMFI